ncbi:MAG TPA: prolyl oligopeptidase family serine peptidase [Bacteroidales bacterium]|nr:prolyl oligopeptidase family serine peptidase [Bacteroidales bacterium]HOK74910.1 prolyl oligopeptidase family serine peptidase [Bacteroidales bacterium]HOM41230.1 prolyl oligopeptidase family serine peptidase [Bacteroidales bacterium]HPP93267.1 prolyl oligopeptidase family serine peptidase [Bacteroidales bacterium]
MKKIFTFNLIAFFLMTSGIIEAQSSLTIEKIMLGEKFIGISPESPRWSPSGNNLYFTWTENVDSMPSLYVVREGSRIPQKVTLEERKNLPTEGNYNRKRTMYVYSKNGDIFLLNLKTGNTLQITSTSTPETSPVFNLKEDKIIFVSGNNIFSWDINKGTFNQLTDFRSGKEQATEPPYRNENEKWLYNSQLTLFKTLAERKRLREITLNESKAMAPVSPKTIFTGQGTTGSVRMSPDEKYVTWIQTQRGEEKNTIVPNYVTESGYTGEIQSRPKVGTSQYSSKLYIFDISRDTVYQAVSGDIPGLSEKRLMTFRPPVWSDDGSRAVVEVLSTDNKDRWIMLLDVGTGKLKLLDNQHDSAWIGGPGTRSGLLGWLPDNKTIYFQSEESGYSHLYLLDVQTGEKKAITSGNFEVYEPKLSNDGKYWYFISNETDPGIRELYRMPVRGGERTRLTSFGGGVEYTLSPDEKYFALRVSFANRPWELYIMENKEKAIPVKITESLTPEFRAYNWRTPEYVRFRASDGTMIPARLYRPANNVRNGAAVIFVHGAGYLQNAHRWWSSYFREYMFHNFLVDNGYTVLDIDYRGSAGYGRDWRTAIYRHMGGKDLDDHIDGAKYLVEEHQIDPERIGIYGGSYGGFITLMAMFTKPGVFAAGAALRPVTDWAHYNHGYTSNILNTPVADSIAYVRSSPIYYAEGLIGELLICHGMIDDNVHFQDVVRLVQRLIELGKDNWELAVYPLESHSFREPSSWTDEYKRIFKLFERTLNGKNK